MKRIIAALLIVGLCVGPAWAFSPAINAVLGTGANVVSASTLKTGLISWYDFADANDSHGSNHLTAVGSPTYTAGTPNYGSSQDSPAAQWQDTALDTAWAGSKMDATFIFRFRGYEGLVNGDYAMQMKGGNVWIRWLTTGGFTVKCLSTTSVAAGFTPVLDTWYTVIAQYESATETITLWVNANAPVSGVITYGNSTSSTQYFGGHTTAEDIQIDYMGFWNRLLTSDERTWLYNSGGTRTYSEF